MSPQPVDQGSGGLERRRIDPIRVPRPTGRLAALLAAAAVLSGGCASLSPPEESFAPVAQAARQHLDKSLIWSRDEADRQQIQARVAQLLREPLQVEDAVQLALLNHRGLQASFFELGIAQADLLRASELANPHISLLRTSRQEGGEREYKIEQAIGLNLINLATQPMRVAIERERLQATRDAVTLTMLEHAMRTRRAYYEAVSAQEMLRYREQVLESASVGSELARRMQAAGNWSALRRVREHRFEAQAALDLAQARQAQRAARERLARLLGLWGEGLAFKLPERLPALPAKLPELPQAEADAMGKRIDLQLTRARLQALARQLGLTQATRLVNVLELGPARVLEGARDDHYKRGYELRFELPIFDSGQSRVARAEALYRQALEQAAQQAIDARSQVRESHANWQARWEIAQHHRAVMVPMARRIGEETLLRYNAMLVGVFDLLADARAQAHTVVASIEATRDFWLAQAEMDAAMLGAVGAITGSAGAGSSQSAGGAADDGAGGH